jgi:hypothetical protein
MRFLANSMLAVLVAVAMTACSGGSSNSADNSASADNSGSAMSSSADNSAASPAAADNSAAAAPGGNSAAASGPPSYPGAATSASGSSSSMAMGAASGKVLTTTDSFEKVYAWYQKNMPAGSEKSHMTTPVKSAVFTIGDTPDDMQSVTLSGTGGKTMIVIAHVKK